MNMKKINKIVFPIILALMISIGSGIGFTSCNDYLEIDDYLEDILPLDSIFKRQKYLDQYIQGTAALLPNEGDLWTESWSPYQGASDENFTSWNDGRHSAIALMLDEVTPFTNFYNNYGKWYQGIRKANIILERIHECEDISDITRRDFIGKAHFLRAYFYMLLVQAYGPVPIVPEKTFGPNDDVEKMSHERETYDVCIDYICDNFAEAAVYLPSSRGSSAEINMPTSGAALAFISRVRLTAASPWFNGNTFYSDWTRTDGSHFISQNVENEKWGLAALAARKVIYDTNNKYQLHTASREGNTISLPANVSSLNFPDGAGNIDPYRSYSYIFNGEVAASSNPELIYIYM